MTDVSLVEADDEAAEFRQCQPHWHLPAQNPALAPVMRDCSGAFAGDHENDCGTVGLRLAQKVDEPRAPDAGSCRADRDAL
jgi:hypothetical protein